MWMMGAIGIGTWGLLSLGYLKNIEPKTLDHIHIKLMLPLLFFFGLIQNDHLFEAIGWEVSSLYILLVFTLFCGSIFWLKHVFKFEHAELRAFFISSNHLALTAAPLLSFGFGPDALPVIVWSMMAQSCIWIAYLMSTLGPNDLNIRSVERYDRMPWACWLGISLGLLLSPLPWRAEVLVWMQQTFEVLSACTLIMSGVNMACYSHHFQARIQESGKYLLLKAVCLLPLLSLGWLGENEMLFLGLMFLAPSKKLALICTFHEQDENMYWREIIAGENLWYFTLILLVSCLPLAMCSWQGSF